MNQLLQDATRLFLWLFRLSAGFVAITLLIFPAFKGVWLGYVPVLLGAAIVIIGGKVPIRRWCGIATPPAEGRSTTDWPFLLLLCIWTGGWQALLIVGFGSLPTFDGLFVYQQAVDWLQTGQIDPITYYAPGQIWYYGLWFKLPGTSPLLAQWVQIPLAMAIPLTAYGMVHEQSGRTPARVASSLTAIYPGMLLYVLVTPYYFYMYTLMILWMVWAWLRVDRCPSCWTAGIIGGLAAGWGTLTKATLLVAPVQAIFFWIVAAGSWRTALTRWRPAVVFFLTMTAVLTPWTLRNIAVFGRPIAICTSGPLVFFSANNPESDGLYSDIPDRVRIETPAEMLAHMDWCSEQARQFIREHPRDFASLVWLKLLHTWGTETTFVELINRRGKSLGWLDPALRFVVQAGWSTLVFAWCAVAWRRLRTRAPGTAIELVAAIFVFSKFLVYSVYEGGSRHHLPVVPLLIMYVTMSHMVRDTNERCDTGCPP